MKVRELIRRYRVCSNADVFLQTPDGKFAKLEQRELENVEPETLMNATVCSFDIIDNVFTIHVKQD